MYRCYKKITIGEHDPFPPVRMIMLNRQYLLQNPFHSHRLKVKASILDLSCLVALILDSSLDKGRVFELYSES